MGVRGHLLQVLDPAEPELPFAGRVRFEGMEHDGIALIGNVDGVRRRYQGRLEAHREGLRDLARSLGWTFASHLCDHAARARAAGALHRAVDQGAEAERCSISACSGFAHPWLLAALVSLPVLWWLLRIIPPAPKEVRFPAVRFLLGLQPEEETSARTPLWLLILRLVLATLLILALAGPVLNPDPELSGDGPLVLVVDDGWAAAPGWAERTEALERFAEPRAAREPRGRAARHRARSRARRRCAG